MSRKLAFVMLALMAAFLLTSTDALAARVRCKAGAPSCEGTQLADSLSGTQKADKIFGYGGNDELIGNLGDDTLVGGDGNDLIFGESGADTISGMAGNDRMFGHDGRDTFIGGEGDDFIDAVFFEENFPEKDTIDCGPGNDTVKADRLDTVKNCEKVTRV
jgi:Ca2+-binding RTX toxin-like protein